ncbi:MAG: hypothetical protein KIT84_08410 [Labilithrix sp.]|nr:hypothetical protein [Labilithrix sp.]MCW5811020.1 hypothetical protein [Labilithrix sp.]
MSDEPRFPTADEAKAQRTAYRSSASTPAAEPEREPTPRRVVVARAKALQDETDERGAVKLTKEEVRALLEVEGANERTSASFWGRRGRVILVPTGLFMFAAHVFFGSAAPYVMFGAAIVALGWMGRSLVKRGW